MSPTAENVSSEIGSRLEGYLRHLRDVLLKNSLGVIYNTPGYVHNRLLFKCAYRAYSSATTLKFLQTFGLRFAVCGSNKEILKQ